jgi:hypothetical protein
MADKEGLQLIGLVLASVTVSIIFIASMLVYAWTSGRLADHQARNQIEQTIASNRV